MLGLQTISCLHDIPVIRSSTDKLQDTYAKAKKTSPLIRLPCNIVETIVDTTMKIVLTVANPLVKPFSGSVRVIDNYAARTIRQMESKYPVINTPTEDVVNTFNEKTEPVRNVVNSVKDTTTSTIQHGRETVSNVATGVADTVFSFCSSGKQGKSSHQSKGLTGSACSTIGSLLTVSIQSIQSSLIWFRMLLMFFLLRSKQINDLLLSQTRRVPFVMALPQRFFIFIGNILDFFIPIIKPDDRTLTQLKKAKQQSRYNPQGQYFNNLPNLRPDPATKARQSNVANKSEPLRVRPQPNSTRQESVVNRQSNGHAVPRRQQQQPDYSNLNDTEELHARLAANDPRRSAYNVNDEEFIDDSDDYATNPDIAQLHGRINATDIELLYSRLPGDVLANSDEQNALNPDQRQLHAKIIRTGLAEQDQNEEFVDDSDDYAANPDIAQLHGRIHPTDMEALYSRLPGDVLPNVDEQDALNPDQQQLHARLIGAGLAEQGYHED